MVLLYITCFMKMILCATSLSSTDPQQLLNIRNDYYDYCDKHDMKLNAKKAMCMYFSIALNKHFVFAVIYVSSSIC